MTAVPPATAPRVLLYSGGRRLLVHGLHLSVETGAAVRKLAYSEEIIAATFTTFLGSDVLAVCFRRLVHVYSPSGHHRVVSLPFALKNAFPFELGLMLEREHDLGPCRFLTLADPLGDFRIVTTLSTSVVLQHECLLAFPTAPSRHQLCVTFDHKKAAASVYHIKALSRTNVFSHPRKRKNTILSTPNPKMLDDDMLHELLLLNGSNMEKKRTSTLLSAVSSMGRVGSEPALDSHAELNYGSLRKDMILTKIDTLHIKAKTSHLAIGTLHYEGRDAVVVSNTHTGDTTVYIYQHSKLVSEYPVKCTHAVPLAHDRFPGWLVVLAGSLQLVHPFLDIVAPPLDVRLATHISSTCGLLVAFSGLLQTLALRLEPADRLVDAALSTWRYLSGSKINETIWVYWRTALQGSSDWDAYVTTLLALFYPLDSDPPLQNDVTRLLPQARELRSHFAIDYSFHDLLPYVVVSLHLLYEETRLCALLQPKLNRLGLLLAQFTMWMGWLEQWINHYSVPHSLIDPTVRFLLRTLVDSPPSVYEALTHLVERNRAQYVRFSQLVEESESVDAIVTPRTRIVFKLMSLLVLPHHLPSHVVNAMVELGVDTDFVESLPLGIGVPLKACLLACQENPDLEWNTKVLDLISRPDLKMLLGPPKVGAANEPVTMRPGRDANAIVANLLAKEGTITAWDSQAEADRIHVTKLIFDQDRRFFEISKLLSQTRTQSATLDIKEPLSEYDMTLMKRQLAAMVALRTLTLPMGRAALLYGGRMPLLTEKFPIPDFDLNTLVAPSMTTIVLGDNAVPARIIEWGHFHNGVSSGLSIRKDSKGVNGSWVVFNKPEENDARHAGFLLGLGLNGHLKKLEEWHIYNYLGPKHPLTSVGLLIGMAASMRGTMDNKLTKVLSVHAVALLPQGANDLNVPILVQTAGLIGIGLLYLELQHRRMSEILLSQISNAAPSDNDEEHEAYRLAAGIALGFINLGKGDDLRGMADTHVVDRLLGHAIALKDSHPVVDSDKSGSGALLALGFIHLKTHNEALARKLELPKSEQLLDYVRPDLVLLRCLVKNLIMWDTVECSVSWVMEQVPESLRRKYTFGHATSLDSDQIGFYSIIGGTCLSVAVKHASSQNLQARATLLHYLDVFMIITSAAAESYDEKIALRSAVQVQNLLALSVAVIMAGSGDLEVFRRLRVLHGQVSSNVGFGNHMAVNMALGFLFLGGGQYCFGHSHFATAALVVSLFPVFPSEHSDTDVHLQVMRHFWALSVEPRCLVVREVTERCAIKIKVHVATAHGVREVYAPCLLPHGVLHIEVKQPGYFAVRLDFARPLEYVELFQRSLTLYVMKKCNYETLRPTVARMLEQTQHELHVPPLLGGLSPFEQRVFAHESQKREKHLDSQAVRSGLSLFNIVDTKLELGRMAQQPRGTNDLLSLRLLFAYADSQVRDLAFLSLDYVEQLKHVAWLLVE